MKTTTLLSLAAAAATATADLSFFKRTPEDKNVAGDCTEFFTARQGDSCRSIAALHRGKFTFEEFVAWNPTVGENCVNGLIAGVPYCIAVQGASEDTKTDTPPDTNTAAPTKTIPATEMVVPPEVTAVPADDDDVNSCGSFYQAKRGDTCYSVIFKFKTLTIEEFIAANPSVGDHCLNGLLEGGWYAVGGDVVEPVPSRLRKFRRSA